REFEISEPMDSSHRKVREMLRSSAQQEESCSVCVKQFSKKQDLRSMLKTTGIRNRCFPSTAQLTTAWKPKDHRLAHLEIRRTSRQWRGQLVATRKRGKRRPCFLLPRLERKSTISRPHN